MSGRPPRAATGRSGRGRTRASRRSRPRAGVRVHVVLGAQHGPARAGSRAMDTTLHALPLPGWPRRGPRRSAHPRNVVPAGSEVRMDIYGGVIAPFYHDPPRARSRYALRCTESLTARGTATLAPWVCSRPTISAASTGRRSTNGSSTGSVGPSPGTFLPAPGSSATTPASTPRPSTGPSPRASLDEGRAVTGTGLASTPQLHFTQVQRGFRGRRHGDRVAQPAGIPRVQGLRRGGRLGELREGARPGRAIVAGIAVSRPGARAGVPRDRQRRRVRRVRRRTTPARAGSWPAAW